VCSSDLHHLSNHVPYEKTVKCTALNLWVLVYPSTAMDRAPGGWVIRLTDEFAKMIVAALLTMASFLCGVGAMWIFRATPRSGDPVAYQRLTERVEAIDCDDLAMALYDAGNMISRVPKHAWESRDYNADFNIAAFRGLTRAAKDITETTTSTEFIARAALHEELTSRVESRALSSTTACALQMYKRAVMRHAWAIFEKRAMQLATGASNPK